MINRLPSSRNLYADLSVPKKKDPAAPAVADPNTAPATPGITITYFPTRTEQIVVDHPVHTFEEIIKQGLEKLPPIVCPPAANPKKDDAPDQLLPMEAPPQ